MVSTAATRDGIQAEVHAFAQSILAKKETFGKPAVDEATRKVWFMEHNGTPSLLHEVSFDGLTVEQYKTFFANYAVNMQAIVDAGE